MKLKKLNNKGVTLVELIVSFALVSVAIIYFYQTLYTVNKLYNKSRNETNDFVQRTYALKLLDAYIDNNQDKKSCSTFKLNEDQKDVIEEDQEDVIECIKNTDNNGEGFKKYIITYKIDEKEKSTYLYKYISTQSK